MVQVLSVDLYWRDQTLMETQRAERARTSLELMKVLEGSLKKMIQG